MDPGFGKGKQGGGGGGGGGVGIIIIVVIAENILVLYYFQRKIIMYCAHDMGMWILGGRGQVTPGSRIATYEYGAT